MVVLLIFLDLLSLFCWLNTRLSGPLAPTPTGSENISPGVIQSSSANIRDV